MKTKLFAVLALLALVCFAAPANAQMLSQSAPTTLQLTIAESLTLSCTPSTVNFTSSIQGGTANGDSPVSCTTTYALGAARTHLALFTYFASSTGLTNGAATIPASSVSASINSGAYNPCSGTDNFSSFGCDGGGVILANSSGTGAWPSGSVTSTVAFEITVTSPTVGVYSGSVVIAVAAL